MYCLYVSEKIHISEFKNYWSLKRCGKYNPVMRTYLHVLQVHMEWQPWLDKVSVLL